MTTVHRPTRSLAGLLILLLGVISACSAPSSGLTRTGSVGAAKSDAVTVIPPQSNWRYLDTGVLPEGWTDPAFDDLAWQSSRGPLGAGDAGLRSVINRTAPAHLLDAFRTGFTIDDPSIFDRVDVRLLADDGALVFLNGVQVLNDNVRPDGYPAAYRGGSEEGRYRDFSFDPSQLRPGLNVVAVELHQDHREDADSGFDLAMTLRRVGKPTVATTAPPVPTTQVPPASTTPAPMTPAPLPTSPPTTAPTPTTQPRPGVAAPAGWSNLYWSDEFDGSGIDASAWKPYHNTYGDGNNEVACLTPDNVSVSGGSLRLTAKRERVTCPGGKMRSFTSGFLGSREAGRYFPAQAYFEIRAKLPHGQGLWPAFWLRHRNGASTAEVDIMEYFHSQLPGRTTQTLHLDGRSNVSKKATTFETPTSQPGWHTWGVAIEKLSDGWRFTFYTDGAAVHSYTDTTARWASAAPSDGTFDIALNLAVGGNWTGDPDGALGVLPNLSRCAKGGTYPNACDSTGIRRADFPSTYEVDYVRVFTR